MFKDLFKIKASLNYTQKIVLGIVGLFIIVLIWTFIAEFYTYDNIKEIDYGDGISLNQEVKDMRYFQIEYGEYVRNDSLVGEDLDYLMSIDSEELSDFGLFKETVHDKLPPIPKLITGIPDLVEWNGNYKLIQNTGKSLWINFLSYIIAIIIAIPLGFSLGLIPLFRGLFSNIFDAVRFLPLAAVTFLFISWFGIDMQMKIIFLSFGILAYLIPVVIQRIDEVREVYLKMAFTLGANTWDTIRTVYLPSVLSRISDDVRVLTAISWTYITVAEMTNNTGGLGGMIYNVRKASEREYTFIILFVIIIIGVSQDFLLRLLDKWLFPFKHLGRKKH